ncbi:MAG: 50S ribosomal protein L10 [Myxococcales bacterium]|nr:MAG: 50S ribosomal protein L10 [Myxococcales bacterium]
MRLEQKQEFVERWKTALENANVVVMAKYTGMTANQMNTLRAECRQAGVQIGVVKNTLVRRALQGGPFAPLAERFQGPIALAYGESEPSAPAKVLLKIAKENPHLQVVAACLDGQVIEGAGIEALSKMPGRNELRASLLGLFNNVPTGFVRVLNAVPGGLVNVLAARQRDLEAA